MGVELSIIFNVYCAKCGGKLNGRENYDGDVVVDPCNVCMANAEMEGCEIGKLLGRLKGDCDEKA